MGQLQKLELLWGTLYLQALISMVKYLEELTIRIKEKFRHGCLATSNRLKLFLCDWIDGGLKPPNLNIYCVQELLEIKILRVWLRLNHTSPPGCTGYVTLYNNWKASLNLFPNLPSFQLRFGQGATFPLFNLSKFGLLGLDGDCILLSGSHGSVSEAATGYKASSWTHHQDFKKYVFNVHSLNMITEFNFSTSNSLFSVHLEQLAVLCPNLQRLNLRGHTNCLRSLQGLRTIADCCHNLQGLNLLEIKITDIENHIQLWEILSDMKLTHLAVELCIIFVTFGFDDNLIKLYQKCLHLKALEIKVYPCPNCENFVVEHCSLLAHFPSLTLCSLKKMLFHSTTAMNIIVTNCKELKYLEYSVQHVEYHDYAVPFTCHLEQLLIDSWSHDISDRFMHVVSAHGGLVHVLLCVKSVTHEGIATLIMNSPKLLTFYVLATLLSSTGEPSSISTAEASQCYQRKFPCRKLFTAGTFMIRHTHSSVKFGNMKFNTEFTPLWN